MSQPSPANVIDAFTDELSRLELRVARRADRLVARLGSGPENDRERWLRAEREELEAFEPAPSRPGEPPAASPPD